MVSSGSWFTYGCTWEEKPIRRDENSPKPLSSKSTAFRAVMAFAQLVQRDQQMKLPAPWNELAAHTIAVFLSHTLAAGGEKPVSLQDVPDEAVKRINVIKPLLLHVCFFLFRLMKWKWVLILYTYQSACGYLKERNCDF